VSGRLESGERPEGGDSTKSFEPISSSERTALLIGASDKTESLSDGQSKAAPEKRTREPNELETQRIEAEVGRFLKEASDDERFARSDRAPNITATFSAEAESYLASVRGGTDVKAAFTGEVNVETLKPGDKIYRVFDEDHRVDGAWWSRYPPPETEEQWRHRDAVQQRWNGNGAYVEYMIPENTDVKVLIGPTAAQTVEPDRHYDSSGDQIYVRGGTGCLDHPDNIRYFKSKWATE